MPDRSHLSEKRLTSFVTSVCSVHCGRQCVAEQGQVIDNGDTDGLLAFLPSRSKFQHDFWWEKITLVSSVSWWMLGRHTENHRHPYSWIPRHGLRKLELLFPQATGDKHTGLVHTKRLYKIGLTCVPPDDSCDKIPHCLWVAAIVLASCEAL